MDLFADLKPLDGYEFRIIEEILQGLDTGESVADPSELDGLLTALVSYPNGISDAGISGIIWNDDPDDLTQPNWKSTEEKQYFESLVKRQKQYLDFTLANSPAQFTPMVYFSETSSDSPDISLDAWCSGFEMGVVLSGGLTTLSNDKIDQLVNVSQYADYDVMRKTLESGPEELVEVCKLVRESVLALYGFWNSPVKACPDIAKTEAESTKDKKSKKQTKKPTLTLVQ